MRGENDGFTYIGNLGRSTIDYVISNMEAWQLIDNAILHSQIESDHLTLSVSLPFATGRIRRLHN